CAPPPTPPRNCATRKPGPCPATAACCSTPSKQPAASPFPGGSAPCFLHRLKGPPPAGLSSLPGVRPQKSQSAHLPNPTDFGGGFCRGCTFSPVLRRTPCQTAAGQCIMILYVFTL